MKRAIFVALALSCALHAFVSAQQVGPNVNVLSGTAERSGDAFLQRQNEAVVAVSTRNSDHLIVAMNDYRTVDMAIDAPVLDEGPNGVIAKMFGAKAGAVMAQTPPEAWIGLAFSRDRGRTWYTALMPGYPHDPSAVGQASPVYGDSAGSDPVLITGQNGRVYLVALTFDRAGVSRISSTRYTDRNNVEGGEPFYFDFTRQIDRGSVSSKGRFADKPSGAAYAGASSGVFAPGAVSKKKKNVVVLPGCERIYTAYTVFEGTEANGNFRNSVYAAVSASCGESWSQPMKISGPYGVAGVNYTGTRNQGTTTAVDPDTGHVYIAWRTYEPNGFVYVKSTDGGLSYSVPQPIHSAAVNPYDQRLRSVTDGQNVTTFRSNAYPSMTIYDGKLYVAWQERVDLATGASSPTGVPRIVMTVRSPDANGVYSWSAPRAVDLGDIGATTHTRCEQEIAEGTSTPITRCRPTGAQVMPYLTARDRQLAIAYYESRHQDPDPVNGDAIGAPGGLATATGEISGMHRQLDVRSVIYNPETGLKTTSFQVSRYPIDPATGRVKENPSAPDPKLRRQVNYPNYPMYRGGLAAFVGDYLHGVPITADGSGPGFRFVFTSNELVVPPANLDFSNYNKPQSGLASACNPGSRNATIMTGEVGTGLVIGSPGTFKQLTSRQADGSVVPVQRAFAVYVENHTPAFRGFQLTVAPSTGVVASFDQFDPTVTSVDLEVLASSSVTRTVYLSGSVATGSAVVTATEIQLPDPAGPAVAATPIGLRASLTLNGDSTNPFVGGPDGNPGLATTETHTPQLSTPQLGTPQLGTPQLSTPQLGTPQLGTPQLGTPQLGTPQLSTPQLGTPQLATNGPTDITYSITNAGNTASGYNSLISLANAPHLTTTGHTFQVFIYRVHRTAAVSGCGIGLAQQDQIIYMTPQLGTPQLGTPQLGTPQIGTPQLGTPQLGTPQLGTPQLGTPQLGTPQLATASFSMAPADPTPHDHDGTEHEHQANDELRLTVRVNHPEGEDIAVAHPTLAEEFSNALAIAVEAQAVDTEDLDEENPEAAGAILDTVAPETAFVTTTASPVPSTSAAFFSFTGGDNLATLNQLTFECSVDGGPFAPCVSPKTYALPPGQHTLAVRARDVATPTANVDATPAVAAWTVLDPTITITSGVPSGPAAGFGQLVTLMTGNAPAEDTPTAVFTQNGVSYRGFVFESPSKQNEYFVRLPFPNDNVQDGNPADGVVPGPATVRIVFADGGTTSQDFPLTVSATPAAPQARFALALTTGPTMAIPCGAGIASNTPITETYAGDGVAISAYGIDTAGAVAVFTQDVGDGVEPVQVEVPSTCGRSSPAIGVAGTFTVPPVFGPGPITVQLKTSVGAATSALSNALPLTIRAPLSFKGASDFSLGTGQSPEAIAAADLNGDGNVDAVTANFSSSNISVLLGTGTAGFGLASNYAAGAGPRKVRLGDLDGDGDLDVAVAQLGGNVSVGLNQGAGTFAPLSSITAPGSNNGLAIADVNGDGRQDIVVAKNGKDENGISVNNVGVLLGNGNGTFQQEALFTAGTFAWDVAAVDLNGDGRRDLVVSNRDSTDVSVLLNNAQGSFDAAVAYQALPAPSGVTVYDLTTADLNGDGHQDVVVGTNGGFVSILSGLGNGTLSAPKALSHNAFARPTLLATADFNADGKRDLAVGSFDGAMSFFRGTGQGEFAAAVDVPTGATSPSAIVIGDVDNDGKPDVLFTRKLSTTMSMLRNTTF